MGRGRGREGGYSIKIYNIFLILHSCVRKIPIEYSVKKRIFAKGTPNQKIWHLCVELISNRNLVTIPPSPLPNVSFKEGEV